MNGKELLVARELVTRALADGYAVSVHDGEEWAVTAATDYDVIVAELGATDMETLRLRKPGERIDVTLIWGNSPSELVADSSAPTQAALDAFNEWLKPITAYAERLEGGRA